MSERDIPVSGAQASAPVAEAASADATSTGLQWLSSRARLFTLSEGNLFRLLAIIIGMFSGMAVVCVRIAIEWVRLGLLGSALAPPPLRVILAPAVAGLVVAFLVQKFFPAARGSGVNQTKAAVYVFDGYVPFRTVI